VRAVELTAWGCQEEHAGRTGAYGSPKPNPGAPLAYIDVRPKRLQAKAKNLMSGDYPSTDFEIVDKDGIRRVMHLPTGMVLETDRLQADPIAVSAAYRLQYDDDVPCSGKVAQAALRHLHVWLMRAGARHARVPT
jgi:hypothetical protein